MVYKPTDRSLLGTQGNHGSSSDLNSHKEILRNTENSDKSSESNLSSLTQLQEVPANSETNAKPAEMAEPNANVASSTNDPDSKSEENAQLSAHVEAKEQSNANSDSDGDDDDPIFYPANGDQMIAADFVHQVMFVEDQLDEPHVQPRHKTHGF